MHVLVRENDLEGFRDGFFRGAAPHIQEGVGAQVRLKYLPKLRFVVDSSIAEGAHIDNLLSQIERHDDEPAAGG